jgi:hypothetical protein
MTLLIFRARKLKPFVDYKISFIFKNGLIVFELLIQTSRSLWHDEQYMEGPGINCRDVQHDTYKLMAQNIPSTLPSEPSAHHNV